MRAINPNGLLMTCSCSGAMTQSGQFLSVLQEASKQAVRKLTQLRYAGPSPDHTLDVSYPEGAYLTNVLLKDPALRRGFRETCAGRLKERRCLARGVGKC
ncbi:hypothetical protein R1flu_008889 [Riccia fluitans]|uniref:Uncharacterized protein n=1 Tax=Riccia fluitans TaxID=41844 RepID=A0ABD1Z3J0_9MARC